MLILKLRSFLTLSLFSIFGILLLNTLEGCKYNNSEEWNGIICDTSSITYTNTIGGIMSTYCTGCHSGGASASGGIDISSYALLKAYAPNAAFMGSIRHASPYSLMPKGGNKLEECAIKKIQAWINNGMLQ